MAKRTKIPNMYIDKELARQYEEERIEKIYQEVKLRTRIKKVNQMLRKLKQADFYEDSIAVANIFNKLDSSPVGVSKTKAGYISLRGTSTKNMTQMAAINKSIGEFLANRTSTVEGMTLLYEERRDQLWHMFDDKNFIDSLTYKDIKNIYSVFQSNEYKRLQSRMGSPEFFVMMTQAIDKKFDTERFLKEMSLYIDEGNDLDLRDDIESLFKNYLAPYANR